MKKDERELLIELARIQFKQRRSDSDAFATDVGRRLGMHWKRTNYILEKWTCRDLWDYGVSTRTGWLTEAGLAFAEIVKGTDCEAFK